MKKMRIAAVLVFFFIAIAGLFLYFFVNQKSPSSKAAGDMISFSYNPASPTVSTNQLDFTLVIKADSLPRIYNTQGYSFKVKFDKTKLQVKTVEYRLGSAIGGLADTDPNVMNTNGAVNFFSELPGNAPVPVQNGQELVAINFHAVTASFSSTDVGIDTTGFDYFVELKGDNTMGFVAEDTTSKVTVNGALAGTPNPTGGYQVSGRVVLDNRPNASMACVVDDATAQVPPDAVTLQLTGNGITRETKTTQGATWSSSFYFDNVPSSPNPYHVCIKDPVYSYSCSTEAAADSSTCINVTVNNGNSAGHRILVNKTGNTSGNTTLNMKVRFQGIINKPSTVTQLQTLVEVKNATSPAIFNQKVAFTANADGTWSGTASFNTTNNGPYSVYIKGPMHLKKRICVNGPTESPQGSYSCSTDHILLNQGANTLDASNIYLLAGDLPVDNGAQNGVIDSNDTSYYVLHYGSTDPAILQIADLNLDGHIDTQDSTLQLTALSLPTGKYDDKEATQ